MKTKMKTKRKKKKETQVNKRLGLIKLIYTDFDPESVYNKLIEVKKK